MGWSAWVIKALFWISASLANYVGICELQLYQRRFKMFWLDFLWLGEINKYPVGTTPSQLMDEQILWVRFKTLSLWLLKWFYHNLQRELCLFITFYKRYWKTISRDRWGICMYKNPYIWSWLGRIWKKKTFCFSFQYDTTRAKKKVALEFDHFSKLQSLNNL